MVADVPVREKHQVGHVISHVSYKCSVVTESSEERQELETEIRALRASLAQERARSRQLKTVIEQKVLEHQRRLVQYK